MKRPTVWSLAAWAVLAAVPSARAASELKDGAGMFGAGAAREARAALSRLEQARQVPVVIETIPALDVAASIDAEARRRAQETGSRGVYVLMARDDKKISGVMVHREFAWRLPEPARLDVRDAFLRPFRTGDFDAGLARGLEALDRALAGPVAAPAARKAAAADAEAAPAAPRSNLATYAAIGLGIFGVLLLIRMVSGGGRRPDPAYARPPMPGQAPGFQPQPGQPGQPMPPGQAPGMPGQPPAGGGFLSGVAGGLGGALLGNYLYNQFAGSGQDPATSQASTLGAPPAPEPERHVGSDGASWDDPGGDWIGDGGDW